MEITVKVKPYFMNNSIYLDLLRFDAEQEGFVYFSELNSKIYESFGEKKVKITIELAGE